MSDPLGGWPKKIALVDWDWSGHHPMYFNHLVLALEDLGINVLALCPQPEAAARTAAQTRPVFSAGQPARGQTSFQKIQLPTQRFGRFRHSRLVGTLWAVRRFKSIEHQIQAASQASDEPVTAIFYACIYNWDFDWAHLAQPWLRLPWTGLYINAPSYRMPGRVHPRTNRVPRPEKMFSGPLCRGIGILDEGIVDQATASIGKPVIAFPDATDERLAESPEDQALGERLKAFAAGRPVVGLFGHLHESKGVATFLETVGMISPSEVCFALAGEVFGNQPNGMADQIKFAAAQHPHLWHDLHQIDGDPRFNHLLATCDVICAAYWDFPHSSGLQTKAAVFQRPLIVSDGYLMAERTRRYHLGEVIPQKDPRALRDAILKLTRRPDTWRTENQPRWTEYSKTHSFEELKVSLKELLAAL
jgi:hypothetical protein